MWYVINSFSPLFMLANALFNQPAGVSGRDYVKIEVWGIISIIFELEDWCWGYVVFAVELALGVDSESFWVVPVYGQVDISYFKVLVYLLLSVVGTLITDNLTDNCVSLFVTTAIFSVALAATFGAWYRSQKTLSIHSIVTTKRELFYWLAILFTFALGTASGDLVAEKLNLGYLVSVVLFAGLIAVVTVAHLKFKLNTILSFWIAYILTRPLGASIGDLLSQAKSDGGLGLGTSITSGLFLVTITAIVIHLIITKRDISKQTC